MTAADRPDGCGCDIPRRTARPRRRSPDPRTGAVLLIVDGNDRDVHRLNVQAASEMSAPVDSTIIPGASHLFEELRRTLRQ